MGHGLHSGIKRTAPAVLATLLFTVSAWCGPFKVAIFDFDHRLDQMHTTARYIETRLKEKAPGLEIDQFSGREDVGHSIRVLRQIDSRNYDLIITITTDALIIANHVIANTPTLFTNVNNPLSLGFSSLGPPGGKISGASYYISVEKQLGLYRQILPNIRRVGFIFDRNNKSKKVEIPEVRAACQKLGIGYKIEVVSSVSELRRAAQRLMEERSQALVIGSSDMLYNNIHRFIEICTREQVPVFSFNRNGVRQGALAALCSDYNQMADDLIIPMALEVLIHGQSPGTMPIRFLKQNRIVINPAQAEKLNLKIAEPLLSQAVKVWTP